MKLINDSNVAGSFRDPSGFMYVKEGVLLRQVNKRYRKDYNCLMESGLFEKLTDDGFLVRHNEMPIGLKSTDDAYKIIKPEIIKFISYPYEWCFSQLKDAAILTLQIQKIALEHGMLLKDASNYNIQFQKGRPIFIDTLSFERYREGEPWVAYRQFCEHFLSPLLLMKYIDPRIHNILKDYIDGIPLEITSKLLPISTRFKFNLLVHIHLHAKSKKRYSGSTLSKKKKKFSKNALLGFIDTLEGAVQNLNWSPEGTEWSEYYSDTNYTSEALQFKIAVISEFIDGLKPKLLWDLGANDGTFSRISSHKGIETISFDIDPACVEKNYRKVRKEGDVFTLPILMDIANPSPDLGWNNRERMSLALRGPCDTLMALALIHHVAISNNVPLSMISDYLCSLCQSLIIEWVPKNDSQVERLLATREDIFADYNRYSFEHAFSQNFKIIESKTIKGTKRSLYLMETI